MVSVIRPGQRVLQIPGYGVQTSRRAVSVAAAANWWAVAGKTCVAAYQPKSAGSYAASKVNLANPGTHDAGDGTAYPTWDTATGWKFNGSTQYLTTGIVPVNDQTWSAIVRISGGGTSNEECVFGLYNASNNAFNIYSYAAAATNAVLYRNAGQLSVAPGATSGVLAMAGNLAFRDGAQESGTIGAGAGSNSLAIILGAINYSPLLHHFSGNILAFASYSNTLTAGEVATVSAAMAAL